MRTARLKYRGGGCYYHLMNWVAGTRYGLLRWNARGMIRGHVSRTGVSWHGVAGAQ